MKNLKFIISVIQEYQDGTKKSFLVRICDTREEADNLLSRLYEEAKRENVGRYSRVSDPMWLDDHHTELQIKSTMWCGGFSTTTKETYFLSDDWEKNIYSKNGWIDY